MLDGMKIYKSGNRVKIINKNDKDHANLFNHSMLKYCNTIMTIDQFDVINWGYKMIEDDGEWHWHPALVSGLADTPTNQMTEIAARLGLKLHVNFDIDEGLFGPYQFTETGLMNSFGKQSDIELRQLVIGEWSVKTEPDLIEEAEDSLAELILLARRSEPGGKISPEIENAKVKLLSMIDLVNRLNKDS